MEDLFFEREAPKPWRFLHPGVWSLVLILIPGLALGVAIASGSLDWIESNLPGVPRSALIGTVVAAVILPGVLAGVLPILWRKRYGGCWLRGDVLTFEPGGISIPRDEIKSWRRQRWGVVLDSTFHPDNVFMRPLLIPVTGEDEVAQALRWLEGTQPAPEEPAAEEPLAEEQASEVEAPAEQAADSGEPTPEAASPGPGPLVGIEPKDQAFSLLSTLALIVVLPVLGGLRFGWEAVSLCFGLGGILSSVASLIVYLCITRRTFRARPSERALLVGRRRLPYEELSQVVIEGRALAFVHTTAEGRERRGWTILPEGQSELLQADLAEKLPSEARASTLPPWAKPEPRRGLARVLIALLFFAAIGSLSLPHAVYGQALAPFGIFKEIHLRDDDGHVLTLLYSPGQERPRFAYFASEGVMGGIAGYEVTVPGLLGNPAYGLSLGSGSRQVDLAQGRIQDGAYNRALETSSSAALRFGDGDWRTTSEALPTSLIELALDLDEEAKLESIPQALEPLLADPACPSLVRDFVTGRTSWRVHEIADRGGERLVAIVLQGRVRTLALLPPGQPYGVEFAVVAGKRVFFRSLSHGTQGRPVPGLPTLTKKEDSQVCWLGVQGWSRAPIGNLNLEDLLEAKAKVREGASAREALRGLLGATFPAGLDPR
jgi:hypothetical protein